MSFEKYSVIYRDYEDGNTLRPHGKKMCVNFTQLPQKDKKYRLFVTGETGLFYQWKSEPDMQRHYHTICDALNTKNAHRARFCLDFSSESPKNYVRRIYKRVTMPPILSYLKMTPVPETWLWGVYIKSENVSVQADGYLRMMLEVRRKHENINPNSVANAPDEVYIIDFPEGSCDFTRLEKNLSLDFGNTSHIGVWIEGVNYSGKVYLESPFLCADGQNLLPEFDTPTSDSEKFDWTAQNLSRKEWPEFEVKLNGIPVFEDEVFERCHRNSEWEADLPSELLCGENTLEIRLISDYHDSLPYTVREIGIIEQPNEPLSLIAVSPVGNVCDGAYLLVRTRHENTRVGFESLDGALIGRNEYIFYEAGLHGIHLGCPKAVQNARFALTYGDIRIEGEISHIAERTPDGVITGTGDMVYIDQSISNVEEYLCWYISNGLGNLVTVRPVYRWCGARTLNPETWQLFARVMNELGLSYVHMTDGRELPGLNANPDTEMLSGKGFLGRQTHEFDGHLFYWSKRALQTMTEIQCAEIKQRIFCDDTSHANPCASPEQYFWNGNVLCAYRDHTVPSDTRKAKERSIEILKKTRCDATRHTGPSTMFKYFLEAGYGWVGAETMYQSTEPLMAFLRGACVSYGLKKFGVHHALQWSTSPHDAPEHFRRYRLALYVSYMQGATDINTEEGLWHMEEYYSHFHRFSDGCVGHIKVQQDFYKYVATHSRTGRFYAPMALLHGNCDGWHAFGNRNPWGWCNQPLSEAEESWQLLKLFYPNSVPGDTLYVHNGPTDRSIGYHSTSPLGNVDVLPIEDKRGCIREYGAAAFMGYNLCEPSQTEKLVEFVENGGRLLLTRAHMIDTTDFEAIKAGRLTEMSGHPFAFACGEPKYVINHIGEAALKVCCNVKAPYEVLHLTDEGLPLVSVYKFGRGEVVLVNALCYPANPAVRPIYEHLLKDMANDELAKQYAWCEIFENIGSAVYDQEDGSRHFYFLAIDWYHPESILRTAYLRIGKQRYEIKLPFGVMIKCVVNNDIAVWPHSENGEVLGIHGDEVRLQGTGKLVFTVAKGGSTRDITLDFSRDAVQIITV